MIRGKVNKTGLLEFAERLKKAENTEAFFYHATQTLGNAVMSKAKDNTPVGDYSDRFLPYNNRTGGTLKDSWKISRPNKRGNLYSIRVINPVFYASYVNYGHKQHVGQFIPPYRTRASQPWVKGQYFLERAISETYPARYKILEPLAKKFLDGVINDGK